MADKIETIQILFQRRNARARGPSSSEQINDNMNELSHDLASFVDQWNNRLTPLTDSLPNQAGTDLLDAFADGLDGKTIYVNDEATAAIDSRYFNTTNNRPSSIYETLDDIYDSIETLEEDLEGQISAFSVNALQVSVADDASLYAAQNVEQALAEVMTAVNSLTVGTFDPSNIAVHMRPAADDTYTLGTSARRWADLFLGPDSLYLKSITGDTAFSVDKTYTVGVNTETGSHTGKLEIKEGGTTIARFSSTGVSFPVAAASDLDDLSDVTMGSPSVGQVLKYDGAVWSPDDDSSAITGSAAINQISFWSATDTIDGDSNLVWDIGTSRLGIHDSSPNERLTLDGILSFAGVSTPTADTGYGKLWYNTASGEFHAMDGSGMETTIPGMNITADRDEGDLAFFDNNGLLTTSSGLNWDPDTQTLGIGTDTPDTDVGLEISKDAGPLLLTRMTQTEIESLVTKPGIIVYNTTSGIFQGYGPSGWQILGN